MKNQQENNRNEDGTFATGVSGNPEGRKIGSFSLVAILKNKLQELPEGQDKETYAHKLILRMLKSAIIEGDGAMIRDIVNRVDGLPKASLSEESEALIKALIIKRHEDGDTRSPTA